MSIEITYTKDEFGETIEIERKGSISETLFLENSEIDELIEELHKLKRPMKCDKCNTEYDTVSKTEYERL